jgi:hypothetical protein
LIKPQNKYVNMSVQASRMYLKYPDHNDPGVIELFGKLARAVA